MKKVKAKKAMKKKVAMKRHAKKKEGAASLKVSKATAPAKTSWHKVPKAPVGGRLKDKVCVVVGAGQTPGAALGNGRATALLFAREGAKLLLVDRDKVAVEDTLAQIRSEFKSDAIAMIADVAKEADCEKIIQTCIHKFKRLDVLHNNVGIAAGDKSAADISSDVFDRIMTVNAAGALWLAKHALKPMRKQMSGVILNVSSIGSIATLPQGGGGGIAYKMAKSAMNNLTQNLAIENAKYGVRANAILPGLMGTPMSIERRAKVTAEAENISMESAREKVAAARNAQVPLRLGGKPSMGNAWDTGYAALWLASEEAKFVSGVLLCVDGAQVMSIGAPIPDRELDS